MSKDEDEDMVKYAVSPDELSKEATLGVDEKKKEKKKKAE